MSAFEEGLRAKADALIARFGQTATYTIYDAESYDNATGKTTKGAPTEVALKALDLPMKEREFTEDVAARASGTLLMSGGELAEAGITPAVNEHVVMGSKTYTLLAINTVGPAGTAIIYKAAVMYA